MIDVTEARSAELLPLRVRLRGVGTIDEETINQAGRSTYPDEKSVLRTEATRNCILRHRCTRYSDNSLPSTSASRQTEDVSSARCIERICALSRRHSFRWLRRRSNSGVL